jgi:hypothetical protein
MDASAGGDLLEVSWETPGMTDWTGAGWCPPVGDLVGTGGLEAVHTQVEVPMRQPGVNVWGQPDAWARVVPWQWGWGSRRHGPCSHSGLERKAGFELYAHVSPGGAGSRENIQVMFSFNSDLFQRWDHLWRVSFPLLQTPEAGSL